MQEQSPEEHLLIPQEGQGTRGVLQGITFKRPHKVKR